VAAGKPPASSPRAREEKKDPLVAMLDSASSATKIRALREYSRLAAKGERPVFAVLSLFALIFPTYTISQNLPKFKECAALEHLAGC
jgi:hypothetical protein